MDFMSVEELGALAPRVCNKLEADEELVLTRNGQPFALIVHTDAADLEENLRAFRAARLGQTLSAMRQGASERGLDQISDEEIEAEIAAVRRERESDDSSRH